MEHKVNLIVLELERIASEICVFGRSGLQTQRKDKDLMSDTGGISKGRPNEPEGKPAREDCRHRYRDKELTPDQRDKDLG